MIRLTIHQVLPRSIQISILTIALCISCGEEETFDRKPAVKTVNTSRGVATTFFISPSARQNFDADLDDLAATRFKETDQVYYAFQIRNGDAGPVTCTVEVLNGNWFDMVSMNLKRRLITIASFSRHRPPTLGGVAFDDITPSVIRSGPYGMETVTLQPNETAILNLGVHQWPDAREKHIQLLPGQYRATAIVVPFCSNLNPQAFEIDFEVVAE